MQSGQTGSIAIFAIVALLLVCAAGAALVPLTATESAMASAYRDGIAAQYLAESGARWGLAYLQSQVANPGTREAILAETDSAAGKAYVPMGLIGGLAGTGPTAGTVAVVIKRDPADPGNRGKRIVVGTAAAGIRQARRQVLIPVLIVAAAGETELKPGLWSNH
ncbi:MAG: hypothetical protein E6X17_03765 [Sporomusaceae bacterium]|nr:hypothetical protein [Sporomusaceae bacterium]